jgi:hypothetical protein
MTTCQTCQSWKLKDSRLISAGLAPCAHGPIYTFNAPGHTCAKHQPATAAAIKKRRLWLNPKRGTNE